MRWRSLDREARVRTIVAAALTAAASVAAALTGGDVRTLFVIAAVIVSIPLTLPLAFGLLFSLDSEPWDDESQRPLSRTAARLLGLALAMLLATGAVVWYLVSPGVASYSAGSLLLLPLVVVLLFWLHRRLSSWVEWVLAACLAPVGPVAYLLAGGDRLWGLVGLTELPLLLLMSSRIGPADPLSAKVRNMAGPLEGPWGPP